MKYIIFLFVLCSTHCAIAQAVYTEKDYTIKRIWKGFRIVNKTSTPYDNYGLIDANKVFILQPKYKKFTFFGEMINFLSFQYEGKWGILGPDGKIISELKYSEMDFLTVPIIIVLNGKYGFIDENAKEIIPAQYDSAGYYTYTDFDKKDKAGMLARVKLNGKWGFINKMNDVIIPFQYDGARRFVLMLAPVMKEGLWGYIDPTGALAIPYKYTRIGDFNEDDEANVELNGKWIVIDRKGNRLRDAE